ncbi:hypothetical protein [Streptomyces sp. NPDC056255]|uniref:hypothetical protein n=1 Tax=Streptomyces sp. NPDC056255 TaxID=3345764 RepID=UPI0035D91D9F
MGSTTVARVDLAAGTVTGDGSTSVCSHGISSDDAGILYNVSATAVIVNITPSGVLSSLDEATGETIGDGTTLRIGKPSSLAVDGAHRIAVLSFMSPAGTPYFGARMYVPDNNATGQLSVGDQTTGTVPKTLAGFAIGSHGGADTPSSSIPRRGPAGRTGRATRRSSRSRTGPGTPGPPWRKPPGSGGPAAWPAGSVTMNRAPPSGPGGGAAPEQPVAPGPRQLGEGGPMSGPAAPEETRGHITAPVITTACFPVPALLLRTNDPAAQRPVLAFAHQQAETARSLYEVLGEALRSAHDTSSRVAAFTTTFEAAEDWRYNAAARLVVAEGASRLTSGQTARGVLWGADLGLAAAGRDEFTDQAGERRGEDDRRGAERDGDGVAIEVDVTDGKLADGGDLLCVETAAVPRRGPGSARCRR